MNLDRLKVLCSSFGVSSAESIVGKEIRDRYRPLCDELVYDRLGSVFAWKKSKNENAKRFMIASPMDEIGFMISEINTDGTLSFISLENPSPNSLLHQRVSILTRNGEYIDGVIGCFGKVLENKCETKGTEDLKIRCGYNYESIKKMVRPGDLVSYKENFCCKDGVLISKALFPRVLNEVSIALLEKIKGEEFDYHIGIGCVAQSVVGYRGTKTATYVMKPDAAVALTVFDAADKKINLGEGVCLGYYDKQMLPSQMLLHDMESKIEVKPFLGTMGNDGSFIHKTRMGTPTVSIGIPMENVGSANEICLMKDADALANVLYSYLKKIDSKKIAEFGFGDLDG